MLFIQIAKANIYQMRAISPNSMLAKATCYAVFLLFLIIIAHYCRGCGCNLRVYDHSNYHGRSMLIKQQNADFRNDYFNDRVESAKVEGNCRWLLYEHTNFRGQTSLINAYNYRSYLSWGGSGNRISSARALPPAGTEAIVLFQHSNFQGRMLVLYDSHVNLPAIDFNDHLSSFIVTGGRWSLYQHTWYYGRSATYGPGDYTSQPSIGDDQLSSVKKL